MKYIVKTFLGWVFLFGVSGALAGEISIKAGAQGLVMENALMQRVIRLSPGGQAAKIEPLSIFDRERQREMLAQNDAQPWFEISIENALVTNQQPFWQYEKHEIRLLDNGGKEVRYFIHAVAGPAKGLQLAIVVQMFPGSTVFREKIELYTESQVDLKLTKYRSKVHLVFPRYTLAVPPDAPLRAEEIRMASWNRQLLDASPAQSSYDERAEESGWRRGRNLSANYMYHPRRIDQKVENGSRSSHKGPVLLLLSPNAKTGWLIAYEHGSPDDDPEQDYISIEQRRTGHLTTLAVRSKKGAYFDGELINAHNPFSSVWTEFGLFHGDRFDSGAKVLWEFLYRWICEEINTRRPLIYYNTWGMQRDLQKKGHDIRGVLTLSRVLQEVEYAAELGVDLFVLDDGWQDKWGDWQPHPGRFPEGLEPVKKELARRGMILGIWLAPLAADSDAVVVRQHPEWLVRNDQGKPITGRWNRYVLCFVSDYYDYFIDVGKRLIDQGVRYFKWDGLDNYLCSSPLHRHGDSRQSAEERRLRHGYELIRYITAAAREFVKYQKDVIVEMDVTEPNRSVGLAFLSEGRYFWMNNGASWYGDRSQYRAKSTRMIPALFSWFLPTVLQTYANYPHNHPIYMAQRYNMNSSLLGGNGFWGNLGDMTREQRLRVGEEVRLAKTVSQSVAGIRPKIMGHVGSSPEIYIFVDPEKAEGQVIAFSGSALSMDYAVGRIASNHLLAVVRNSYTIQNDSLILHFEFPMPDVSREAFLLSNRNSGIRLVSSTSWLKQVRLSKNNVLWFTNGAPGEHLIRWPTKFGRPEVQSSQPVETTITGSKNREFYSVQIKSLRADSEIKISGR